MSDNKMAFLKLDVTPQEKADYIRAAKSQDMKLAAWVRETLNDETARLKAQGGDNV